jgi:hypothetical protein
MKTGALSSQSVSERGCSADLFSFNAQTALPLLQRMLFFVRRSRETPLQFEIDSEGIVAAALQEFGGGISFDAGSAEQHLQVFNSLIHRALGSKEEPLKSVSELIPKRPSFANSPVGAHSLAAWLDQLYQLARAMHPEGIDILTLRVQRFESRDIAEQLDLGRRLVDRILNDLREEWPQITGV